VLQPFEPPNDRAEWLILPPGDCFAVWSGSPGTGDGE